MLLNDIKAKTTWVLVISYFLKSPNTVITATYCIVHMHASLGKLKVGHTCAIGYLCSKLLRKSLLLLKDKTKANSSALKLCF